MTPNPHPAEKEGTEWRPKRQEQDERLQEVREQSRSENEPNPYQAAGVKRADGCPTGAEGRPQNKE
jgi:hypothetical protein